MSLPHLSSPHASRPPAPPLQSPAHAGNKIATHPPPSSHTEPRPSGSPKSPDTPNTSSFFFSWNRGASSPLWSADALLRLYASNPTTQLPAIETFFYAQISD